MSPTSGPLGTDRGNTMNTGAGRVLSGQPGGATAATGGTAAATGGAGTSTTTAAAPAAPRNYNLFPAGSPTSLPTDPRFSGSIGYRLVNGYASDPTSPSTMVRANAWQPMTAGDIESYDRNPQAYFSNLVPGYGYTINYTNQPIGGTIPQPTAATQAAMGAPPPPAGVATPAAGGASGGPTYIPGTGIPYSYGSASQPGATPATQALAGPAAQPGNPAAGLNNADTSGFSNALMNLLSGSGGMGMDGSSMLWALISQMFGNQGGGLYGQRQQQSNPFGNFF